MLPSLTRRSDASCPPRRLQDVRTDVQECVRRPSREVPHAAPSPASSRPSVRRLSAASSRWMRHASRGTTGTGIIWSICLRRPPTAGHLALRPVHPARWSMHHAQRPIHRATSRRRCQSVGTRACVRRVSPSRPDLTPLPNPPHQQFCNGGLPLQRLVDSSVTPCRSLARPLRRHCNDSSKSPETLRQFRDSSR